MASRRWASANSSCHGQAEAIATLMRRTLMRTRAPSFSSFSRMVPQVASANWVCASPMRRKRAEQHIGHRGKPQAELVGPHGGGRGAVGEQIELALLDTVLHLAAGAVDLLVEAPPIDLRRRERGDDEARVGLVARHLGLADDAAFPAPTVQRRVAEVLEAARRPAAADGYRAWRRSARPSPSLPAARCAPGRTGSPRDWPRTTPSAASRAKPESPRSRMRVLGQRRRIWPTIRATSSTRRRMRRCSTAAASPPADDGRRRCRAADSSSSRNSRGRTGPPAARAADRPWHPGPG